MGGTWSGRHRASRKAAVEGRLALDATDLGRLGLLTPGAKHRAGTLTWHRGEGGKDPSSVGYGLTLERAAGALRLCYRAQATGEALDYVVRLAATPCHL